MTDAVGPISPEGYPPNRAIRPNQQRSTQKNATSFQRDRPRKTKKRSNLFIKNQLKIESSSKA